MTETIPFRPIGPFAAEVDIRITDDLSPDTIGEIRAIYDRHHVVVFRDQTLSHEQQIRFIGHFGPVLRSAYDGVGYISNQPGKGGLGNAELAFHSDLAFNPEPFLAISLHAVDVENERSSTRYVDSCLAYRTLPEAVKARIQDLHALHVMPVDQSAHNDEDVPADMPRAVHPLMMTHPKTGEPILYMNFNQTARIVELPPQKSKQLIQELFAHIYRPDFIYDHRWRMGDLVLWDNLATQHARGDVSQVGRRTLQRVVIAKKGFFEQNPQYRHEQFDTPAVA
jgi:taurine dioxygenase